MQRNAHFTKLKKHYLFPEIQLRKEQFLKTDQSHRSLISLSIGDTTEPIPHPIADEMALFSRGLGSLEGYSGYGSVQGDRGLRESIARTIYANKVDPDEIFLSDGAKCDIGRLQLLFGATSSIAVQDPAYPVYEEGSQILGVQEIVRMPCCPENNFFPVLAEIPRTDLIWFGSPSNPTGVAASDAELKQLVHFARKNRSIILFDAAYSGYIQDSRVPRTIFDIPDAKHVAIEINSFSKLVGFTGVRLAWTVVPKELLFEEGTAVRGDWYRLLSTLFNGASNIAQAGGRAALEKGMQEIQRLVAFYMENSRILRLALQRAGYEVFGGENTPFLWVRFKGKTDSWAIFQQFLEKLHLVVTPGSGFGVHGSGFIRLSAFGHREAILEASDRIVKAEKIT